MRRHGCRHHRRPPRPPDGEGDGAGAIEAGSSKRGGRRPSILGRHSRSSFPARRPPMNTVDAKARRKASLATPTGLGAAATRDISGALNKLLADMLALYLKTKNFHWHVSGPHFR